MGLTKQELVARIAEIKAAYGEWSYDIPLPHGVWTRGNQGIPHTRLKRCVQILRDVLGDRFASASILDLGCLDGIFSVEFALQGAARVVGVNVRKGHIEKCLLAKAALQLDNLELRMGDVREVLDEPGVRFDAVLCSGLLYHFNAPDVFEVMKKICDATTRLAIFDTHISLKPTLTVEYKGKAYRGHSFAEHSEKASTEEMERAGHASFGNTASFWFTRPSLVNALTWAGFSSVYECFAPAHINFGQPGLEHRDRCTFVCLKGSPAALKTSPTANSLAEDWPENSLDYALTGR